MLSLTYPTPPTRVTNSFEKIFSGIMPWGRRPVLGTGSGRFESFIPDFFTMFVERTISCSFMLSRRLIGRTPAFEAENLGSSPSNSELWLWSSSLRLRIVISKTWARIPLATPNAHLGKTVIQLIANQ